MIQFLLFAGLTVATLAFLVAPLLRAPTRQVPRAVFDLEVYRDQLKELEADARRGLISEAQAAAAKREIERRILALDLGPERWGGRGAPATQRLIAAGAILIALPLAAGALYLGIGAPLVADQPLAERAAEVAASAEGQGDIDAMVERLAEKLALDPDNVEGWVLLARSYGTLGRYEEAVGALRTVVRLTDRAPDYVAMLAEHIVFAADGIVTPEAAMLFDEAAVAQPDNPAVLFYRGLAAKQAGELAGALETWTALARSSPPEAPWLASLRGQIEEAARAKGDDPAPYLAGVAEPAPPPPEAAAMPGPSEEDIAAAADMTEDEQAEMIRGMVARLAERLEQEPDDRDGWLRLGSAYRVLGESAAARDALAKAAGLWPDDPRVLEAYAASITEAAPQGSAPPDAAVLVWRRVLELEGANPGALWALGQAARARGRADEARDLLVRLRDLLPEGSAERARVEQELGAIAGG